MEPMVAHSHPALAVNFLCIFLIFLFSGNLFGFEIISHKGVHHEECLTMDYSCLSSCLTWKEHNFIENTIPAIRRAFELGVDRVEIDLQFSKDGEVMVYHDNKVKCRTGVDKFVDELSVAELKKLDVAKGLQFLNIEGNPLAGKGKGLMPTLDEVLTTFPGKGFLLNPKRDDPRFLLRLNRILEKHTHTRATHKIDQFSMWGPYGAWKTLKSRFPDFGARFSNGGMGRNCLFTYKRYAWSGYFPEACRGFNFTLSIQEIEAWDLWGGPLGIVQAFHKNGEKIYLLHIETNQEFRKYYSMNFDGVVSSRLEILEN